MQFPLFFNINVFRLFRRAEQTTTRYAGVQQMLYIVNALRVECEEWRVEQQRLCR